MAQFRLLILFLLFPGFSPAQVNETQGLLSPIDIKKDIAALRTALEKHHPGLYWYTSKEEFKKTWDSLDQSVNEPSTELEFFRLLLPVVAKVKCAHTLFYPSASVMSTGTRFPLDVKLIASKIYLMPDSDVYNIPRGSELISINNKSVEVILQQLLPNFQAQGGNQGWKEVITANDFQNYYYYLIEQPAEFVVKYFNYSSQKEESTVIRGRSDESLRKHWKNWYPATDGPPLNIQYANDSDLAILTIRSLVRDRAKAYNQDFDKLIEQYFDEISTKGIKRLIIDVRGNEGGNNPEKLYSYIAQEKPASKEQNETMKIRPSRNSFKGSVIVLANERSISAQEIFVSIFKYYKRGLTVGSATPGCFKGLCGGKKHKLVLPNSKFEILIPMHASKGIHDHGLNLKPGEGFPPDFHIKDNIDDIVQGRDAAMIFALDLIQKTL